MGCNVAGFTHEFHKQYKMEECPLHKSCITRQDPLPGNELRDWKDKVDSGEWNVDPASYEKYSTLLKKWEERLNKK